MPNQMNFFTHWRNRFLLWLGLTFAIWWAGVGPSDFFALPALFCLVEIGIWIAKGNFYENFGSLQRLLVQVLAVKKIRTLLIGFFVLQGLLWLAIVILRYYAFQMSTWDSGIFSNLLYNAANGEHYSSILKMHSFGIHFSPSFSLLGIFYKIYPSFHWMMAAKLVCFAVTPLVFYRVLVFELKDKEQARFWALILTSGWLVLYSPVVNSMRFEFQPNSLSLPFVAAFYLMIKKDRWVWAALLGVFLLGFKEILGAVLIGVGLHRFLIKERPVQAVFLMVMGILAIYVTMFQIMPYVRDSTPVWSIRLIDPFAEPLKKILYLFKLLVPLGFLPLIFWRNGIMAGPAIGVNLIAGLPTMFSAHYHYDDVSGTLLFLSVIISIKDLKKTGLPFKLPRGKGFQIFILLAITFAVTELPRSAPRYLFAALPEKMHFEVESEIVRFNAAHPTAELAVQDYLGPHFMRRNVQILSQQIFGLKDEHAKVPELIDGKPISYIPCDEDFTKVKPAGHVDYLVLSRSVSDYQIPKIEQCISDIEKSSQFRKISGYQHLIIFEKLGK